SCAFPGLIARSSCDPATRRRVIIDRHPVAEKFDDDDAGPGERRRAAGRDASQAPETPECRVAVPSRWPTQFIAPSTASPQDAASCAPAAMAALNYVGRSPP